MQCSAGVIKMVFPSMAQLKLIKKTYLFVYLAISSTNREIVCFIEDSRAAFSRVDYELFISSYCVWF